jgi:hypothetical protein
MRVKPFIHNCPLANHIAMLFGAYKLEEYHHLGDGHIRLTPADQEYIIHCINAEHDEQAK